ncbi:MAG TPA: hypothetical protein VMA74_11060, partial [Dyella sp.]|uniref:ADP-ribosyltransferase-containing protein n=1 Tax=Dyella sp. TaxID=1869338 RepID=UPI002BC14A3D
MANNLQPPAGFVLDDNSGSNGNASPTLRSPSAPPLGFVMDGAQPAATPQAQLKPPSGIGGWIRSQLQGTGQQDYGQGLGYLVDNPVTRGLGGAANSIAAGAAELAQRGVGVVSPTGEAWLKRNVTTPLAQRQAQFEAPQSAGLGANVTQALSGLGAQISAAVLSGGEAPEIEAAAAAPGILSKVAPYLTRPALQGAAALGLTQAGSEAAQQEAAGQQPESTAALLGKGVFDTAANLVPMGGRGSVLKRALTGALAGEGVNEAQNLVNGQPLGTGALLSAGLGAGLGLVPHAHVPYPEAQPGSMSDAANTIAASNARTAVLQRPSLNDAAANSAPEASAGPQGPAAPSAPGTSATDRIQPATPSWVNPDTGEITAPSKDQLAAALANHLVNQYAATNDIRFNTKAIADAWNVPEDDVKSVRTQAQKMASASIQAAKRNATPADPSDNAQTQPTDNGPNLGAAEIKDEDGNTIYDPTEARAAADAYAASLGLKPVEGATPGSVNRADHQWLPADDKHDVVYSGATTLKDKPKDGTSIKGIAFDPDYPKSLQIGEHNVDTHWSTAQHEIFESWLMHHYGQDYVPAHNAATDYENDRIAKRYPGIDPQAVQNGLKPFIDKIRAKRGQNQPPGLDAKPYNDEGEQSLVNPDRSPNVEPVDKAAAAPTQSSTQEDDHAAEVRSDQASVPETPPAAATSGAAGGEDLQRPAQAEPSAGDQVQRQEEVAAKEPKPETPPTGGVSVSKEGSTESKVIGFKTSKGSKYSVHEDGTTSRDKAYRPEHGVKEQGPQPRSQATFYVDRDGLNALGEVQAQGGPAMRIAKLKDGRYGVQYMEGKDAGKFERRTVVGVKSEPEKGLYPVELWKDGSRVHFGNEITDVQRASLQGSKSATHVVPKPDTAAEDARSVRVKTPEGEVNGQTHVDQLVAKGYNKVRSVRANDRLVHSLVNDAGEGHRLKAKQLRYAEEATTRAEKPSAAESKTTSSVAHQERSPYAAGNKVVDDDGKPLTVYHGTNEMFSGPFDQSRSRDAGVWFTPHKPATEMYGKNVIPAHVRLENPYEAKVGESRQRAIEKAGYDGHDGVIVRDDKGKIQTLSVFDSDNIHRLDEAGSHQPDVRTIGDKVEDAAREAALSPHNDLPEPTPAQKEAGNYQKGHVSLHGLDISIENPRGSTRSGLREDGSTWSHEMSDHYGYIKRTEGADGEHVDVYIGPKPESKKVYVVDQLDQKTRGFDEHKAMLGFTSKKDAIAAYKSNFDKGWKVGPVHAMDMDEFKDWLKNGDTSRPAAERSQEGSALFRKQGEATEVTDAQRDHEDRITDTVGELTKDWKGNDLPGVHVVATADQLPARFRADAGYKTAKGAYDGKGIWIVADRHPDTDAGRADLAKTLAHEAIGHYGM